MSPLRERRLRRVYPVIHFRRSPLEGLIVPQRGPGEEEGICSPWIARVVLLLRVVALQVLRHGDPLLSVELGTELRAEVGQVGIAGKAAAAVVGEAHKQG